MAEGNEVTLDDLLPIDYVTVAPLEDGWEPVKVEKLQTCTRCGGVVADEMEAKQEHKRWHAAIEANADPRLSTLRRAELDRLGMTVSQATGAAALVQQGGGGGDTGDKLQLLRDQLIERFNLVDDGDAGYGGDWLIDHLMKVIEPHVEQQVEQYADRARDAEAADLRRQGELQRANDLVKELRKQVESLSQASQGQRRDLRAVLGMGVDTTWSQMIRLIGQQREYVALLERKSQDCAVKHTPVFEPSPCVKHREFIDRVWQIALEAGHKSGSSVTDWIEQQLAELAEHRKHEHTPVFRPPAADPELATKISQAVHDPGKFVDRDRTWDDTFDRWQYEGVAAWGARAVMAVLNPLADEDEPTESITDEQLSTLLLLVGIQPSAAQLSAWTDEQREQAANWAGAVHLQASDNDVDVPERPAFLDTPIPGHDRPLTEQELAEIYQASGWGTAEQAAEWAKGEPCPSLYLHNGELLTCTVTDRSGHTAHYSGQNDTVTGHEIAWGTSEAVPVPWPLDQEPPAGINTLRDTGAGETLSYLCRATRTWVWSDKPALQHGPWKMLPWVEAVLDADGDLHVVRP